MADLELAQEMSDSAPEKLSDEAVELKDSAETEIAESDDGENAIIAGRFRVEKKLGEGGMGQVFLCNDIGLERLVAVKLLPLNAPNLSIKRFHIEAKSLAQANHANILRVLDFGQAEDSRLYLVSEYIEGQTLASVIDDNGAMPLEKALPILAQICEGLSYAHERGIVHRDIKPSNVMLVKNKSGIYDVKLVDFGLAKMVSKDQYITKTGTALGTPTYMSPEAVEGRELDTRSDIYSFGCLMYELLAGTPPFMGPTMIDTMFLHCDAPPPTLFELSDIEFPPAVEAIVATCLAKHPDDRYQTAKQIINEIERIISGGGSDLEETIVLTPEPVSAPKSKRNRLKRFEPYLVSVSSVMLIVSLLIFSLHLTVVDKNRQSPSRSKETSQPNTIAEPRDEIDLGIAEFADDSLKSQAKEAYDPDYKQSYCQISGDLTEEQLKEAAQKFSNLKIFRFYRAPLKGAGLQYFAGLPLDELNIEQTPLSAEDYNTIGKMHALKRLVLLNSSPISQSEMENVSGLKQLQMLSIRSIEDSPHHFKEIGKLENLENLSLMQYRVNRAEIQNLEKLHGLTTLSFNLCELSSDCFSNLKHFKKLEALTIIDCPLSVDNITYIVALPLTRLQVSTNKVSDYSLTTLAQMKQLQELDLRGSSMNQSTLRTLKTRLPRTTIRTGELEY